MGRKIISALSGAHEIEVYFDNVLMDLEGFRSLIEEYISLDNKKCDPYLPQKEPLDKVFEKVKKSSSFKEVFDSINIPPVEDCLDVL